MSRVEDEACLRQPTVGGHAANLDETLPAPYLYEQLLAERRPSDRNRRRRQCFAAATFADSLGPL
jgi:hypothetical protein